LGAEDSTYAEPAVSKTGLQAGSHLGRFVLRRVLGEGGMGVVWAAHDPDLDREIAIKVVRQASASAALRKRLLREARAMARLKHPNVITVYEVGSAGEVDFIAMELVEGATMDDWLAKDPPADDVWRAMIAAGRGLAAAHAAGLVHRDFKPHNVLRSRDGRVLVTDFGLARGLGEEAAAEEAPRDLLQAPAKAIALDETLDAPTKTPSRPASDGSAGARSGANAPRRSIDSVLDSPLTQTGMLIGTPAYMAPEQFVGAEPDPRTDQFAYCVSAWQALTGARPFTGDTLEELRRAAASGVSTVVSDLPKSIRAVLARGLDPDPAKRWPDLDALLDALERDRRAPRRRVWPYVAASAILIAAGAFFVVNRGGPERAIVVSSCEPADKVFAEAWSDAARGELAGRASEAVVDRIARAFDQYRTKWTASYQEACNAAPSKQTEARLACLRGVRDHTVALRVLLRTTDPRVFETIDLHGMLPNMAGCNSSTPVAPSEVPQDQPRRGKVLELLARAITLRGVPRDQLPSTIDKLLADAQSIGWKPLVSIIQVNAGNVYLRHRDYTRARELLRAAAQTADVQFQALAHVSLLEASVHELERPGYGAVEPKPGAMHEELARAFTYARNAVRAAGNDPMLSGAVALLEAEARADQGLWNRYRQPYKNALANAAEAKKEYEKAGDLRRAARVAAMEAEILLSRGNERALDDALFVVRSAEESLASQGLEREPSLDELRAQIAFAKGELADAHERFDRVYPAPRPLESKPRTGRVVDKAGNPVRARVVAWTGELHGDAVRAYTQAQFVGEVVETNTDGTFSFKSGEALIAEAGAQRSAPAIARDGITLVVEPTTTTSGVVDGKRAPTVEAFARFPAGSSWWYVHAPIAKDGAYKLDGLPRGARTLGVVGPAGNGMRMTLSESPRLAWPVGQAIEVIVRAPERDHTAMTWIFRGKVAPKTREEAHALVAKSADVATASLHPVGADATDAGREVYAHGDHHAIIINNADGDVTACVALVELPQGPVYCQTITVASDPSVNYDDGTINPGVSPVLFTTAGPL
jgi:serine/threonine protein kinase